MFPIKTYADMADDTYMRGLGIDIETRRKWARLELWSSDERYLSLKCSNSGMGARITMHRGQVKRLIKALQKFLKESEAKK